VTESMPCSRLARPLPPRDVARPPSHLAVGARGQMRSLGRALPLLPLLLFPLSGALASPQPLLLATPEDLRGLLRQTQWGLLPQDTPVLYDAGGFYFLPADAEARDLLQLLLLEDGTAPVVVAEDAETRETVLLDAAGGCVGRLPPPAGYSSDWAIHALAPDGLPAGEYPAAYDPSRVLLRVTLLPLPPLPNAAASKGYSEIDASEGEARTPIDPPSSTEEWVAEDMPVSVATAFTAAEPEPPDAMSSDKAILDAAAGNLAATTNLVSNVTVQGLAAPTVHVSAMDSGDAWTGRAASPAKGKAGAKRSLQAGLSALAEGGLLVVGPGRHTGDLDIRGRNVRVRFEGCALLMADQDSVPPLPPSLPAPVQHSATGTVSVASH